MASYSVRIYKSDCNVEGTHTVYIWSLQKDPTVYRLTSSIWCFITVHWTSGKELKLVWCFFVFFLFFCYVFFVFQINQLLDPYTLKDQDGIERNSKWYREYYYGILTCILAYASLKEENSATLELSSMGISLYPETKWKIYFILTFYYTEKNGWHCHMVSLLTYLLPNQVTKIHSEF